MVQMIKEVDQDSGKPPEEYFRKMYKRHFQGALVQAGASLIMWLFAMAAYLLDIISHSHFIGVSLAVLYLLAINPPLLWVFKRIQHQGRLVRFSILINFLEIIGYTAVIYFLGGIEATYLTALYAAVIAYVGSISKRRHTFLITGICIAVYNAMILLEGASLIPWYKIFPDFHIPWSHRLARMFVVDGLLLVVAYITSFTAILLRKAKHDLLTAHGVLERQVAERTAELSRANEELRLEIAERKQATEALRENENRLLAIVEGTQALLANVDANGYFTYVNEATTRAVGYAKPEELIGKSYLHFIYSEDRQRVIDTFKNQIKMRQLSIIQEFRVINTEGKVKWFSFLSTLLIKDGKFAGQCGVAQDITDRKQAEDALRESEERYRSLFKNNHAVMLLIDPANAAIVDANPAACTYYGWSREELMKRKIDEINILRSKEVIAEIELARSEKRNHFFFKHRRADSSIRNVEVYSGPILINGKILLYSIVHDISDRIQAEEEKKRALEYAAEQSKFSLIGQVAGKMAHDFNNVLMGIMGNAQLAELGCDDMKIKEQLKRIVEFAERGRDITNSLISYSKDQEPKQTYFKIEDKIELVLKMFEKELKGIEVSRNYKPGIPALLADPGMIQDALANLLQNSIHAMSMAETPRLKLKAYSEDNKVYFEIDDNGCGIPKEHHDSIFTPSFTLKGSHDKTGSYKLGIKGAGYGMSNVKKYIVEKHKGSISLESEIGKGTKITISLKIIKNHLSPDEKKEVVKSQIYDRRRILLVEDEVAIVDVQYQILTKEPFNHVVSTAINGQMAIDVFDRNKFDVVSLDYMLPGHINGLDVYNHIRKNDGNIPVMFISGNIEFLESIKKLKEKDPNLEHLSKPVSNLEYVHKINELIERTIKKKIDRTILLQENF